MQGADGDSTSAVPRSAGSPDEIRDRSDGLPDRPRISSGLQGSGAQFGNHGSQRLRRIGSLTDRAADHQIIGAGLQRLARGENALLVIGTAAGGTNARGHQLQTRLRDLQRLRLLRLSLIHI